MKRELLERLQYENCGLEDWDLQVVEENGNEVRTGTLICKPHNKSFPIENGVINMLGELTEEVAHEKEHAESHGYIETNDGGKHPINRDTIYKFKDLLLSLPTGDGSYHFQPGGSFDNQAGNADRFFKTLDLLNLKGGEKVLEVGASFGWSSWRFAQRGCDVVAVDICDYLQAADLYFEADGSYYERMMADMSNLPFKDNSFDIIFSHSVIHHCKDLGKLFSEFRRVLRPGGRVVALHECSFGLLEDKSGAALQEAIDEGFNENAYTVPQWKKGAKDGGFSKTETHFFSLVDDYIFRKELRGAPKTTKLKLAYWIQKRPWLNSFLNALSVWPRIVLRPKAWMLIATK